MTLIPEYSTRQKHESETHGIRLRWAAAVCGGAPLVAGVGVFFRWTMTRQEGLEILGIVILIGGLLSFIFGAALLRAAYNWRLRECPRSPSHLIRIESLILFLLLSNFPAAGGVLWGVGYVSDSMVVTVKNAGNATVRRLETSNDYGTIRFGEIAPGASAKRRAHWARGELHYTLDVDGKISKSVVESTQDMDEDMVAGAHSDGGIMIEVIDGTVGLK